MIIEKAPERFAVPLSDGVMTGWRWPNSGAPPLLFCHATGFCASAYKQMLQQLADQFDVYAVDMRGHGHSSIPANPEALRSWTIYANDITAFLERRRKTPWTLAGHSMGAGVVATVAAGRTDIASVKLIEPVALPVAYSIAAKTPIWRFAASRLPMVRQTASRRAEWPSRAKAAATYQRKALFRSWRDGTIDDYLEDGMIEDGDGVRLACSPRWEAATFIAQANDFWGAVKAGPGKISVLAATGPTSTVRDGAAAKFARLGVSLSKIPDVTHLLPMERPDIAARFVAAK